MATTSSSEPVLGMTTFTDPGAATTAAPGAASDAPLFALENSTSQVDAPTAAATTPPQGAFVAQPVFGTARSPGAGSGSSGQQALLAGAGPTIMPPGGQMGASGGAGSSTAHHAVSLNSPDAQTRNVYVASLPANFTDDNLRDLFVPYGAIVSSKMFNNDGRPGSHGRAYGFVMFADESSVQKAIDALVGAVVGSQRIQVRRAKMGGRTPSASGNPSPMTSNTNAMPGLMAGQPAAKPAPTGSPGGQTILTPPSGPAGAPAGGNVLVIQPGSQLTLQHIGTNAAGQNVFLTASGQQVVLGAPAVPIPTAPQPAMVMVPAAQQQQGQPGLQPAFAAAAPAAAVPQGQQPLFFAAQQPAAPQQ